MYAEHAHVGNDETVTLQPHYQEAGVRTDRQREDHDDPSDTYWREEAGDREKQSGETLDTGSYLTSTTGPRFSAPPRSPK